VIPAPNPEALEYLEADLDTDSSTHHTFEEDFTVTLYEGALGETNFQRPMFQLITDQPNGKARARVYQPCAACLDFSRSWNCPDHHEPLNLDNALALALSSPCTEED
jgi:hypothetical protein